MSFSEYLDRSWATHDTDAKKISEEFKQNFHLMETEDDVMAMARLIVHICGEHLGDWQQGLVLLRKLKNNASIKDKSEMNRLVAILNLGNFPETNLENYSIADSIRIYAQVAQALANLGGTTKANKFYTLASEMLERGQEHHDLAIKAMAIAGNNIASILERKENRSQKESDFMILAANLARKYWEIVGSWKEIERAEYRLAQSYIKANMMTEAKLHAEKCLEIVMANKGDALELFFAYEVLALTLSGDADRLSFERTCELMKFSFDELCVEDQNWCQETLDKVLK